MHGDGRPWLQDWARTRAKQFRKIASQERIAECTEYFTLHFPLPRMGLSCHLRFRRWELHFRTAHVEESADPDIVVIQHSYSTPTPPPKRKLHSSATISILKETNCTWVTECHKIACLWRTLFPRHIEMLMMPGFGVASQMGDRFNALLFPQYEDTAVYRS